MIMPHPLDRPYQQETYDKIINSDAKFIIVQSPTGSGKSAWAAQAACDGHRVISLSHTKSLQVQYEYYGFSVLFGKSNYDCYSWLPECYIDLARFGIPHGYRCVCGKTTKTLPDNTCADCGGCKCSIIRGEYTTADLCPISISSGLDNNTKKLFADINKNFCSCSCPYPLAKDEFLASVAGALNYHKFLLDRPLIERFYPEYLFLDEAHLLSDLVVDFSGITLNWKSKNLMEYCNPAIIDKPQPLAIIEGVSFLNDLLSSLKSSKPAHPKDGGSSIKFKWWERITEKIDIVLAAIKISPECWFIKSDENKMIIRPLTARFHFLPLFDKAKKIVLMSATIGNPDIFMNELGIKKDFEFINVPNSFPAPMRSIVDLQAPKMGYRSSTNDWLRHSQVIADAINKCPDYVTGIVHSPSKWLAYDLADRLGKMTRRPMHVPQENIGTEQVIQDWIDTREPGKICVAWNLWEGVNAGEDDICIVAKMPFIDFSEPFDKERFMFDGKAGYQRVANKFTQGLGRIRRGKPEHYGNGKLVAIADGNWKRLRKYISQDILDSIV